MQNDKTQIKNNVISSIEDTENEYENVRVWVTSKDEWKDTHMHIQKQGPSCILGVVVTSQV